MPSLSLVLNLCHFYLVKNGLVLFYISLYRKQSFSIFLYKQEQCYKMHSIIPYILKNVKMEWASNIQSKETPQFPPLKSVFLLAIVCDYTCCYHLHEDPQFLQPIIPIIHSFHSPWALLDAHAMHIYILFKKNSFSGF